MTDYLVNVCKRELALKVVQCLCEKECMVAVNNGKALVLKSTSHDHYIYDSLFTSNMDMLLVSPVSVENLMAYGWVKLRYDRDYDSIVDYSPNLVEILKPALDMAHLFHLAMTKTRVSVEPQYLSDASDSTKQEVAG